MGIAIRIADATFTKYIGVAEIEDVPIVPDVPDEPTVPDTYPVTDTLKGLYYLGGTEAESLVNHAEGGNNATIHTGSSFTVADAYATFSGNEIGSRIATGITTASSNKTTIIALFRVPTGTRPLVSNYTSSGGASFTNHQVSLRVGGSNANEVYKRDAGNTNFAIAAMTIDANGCRVVADVSGGSPEVLLNYTGGVDPWSGQYFIGGASVNLSLNATADIAMVSIHEGDVSDPQLKQIFAYVRNYGESKGLTIE